MCGQEPFFGPTCLLCLHYLGSLSFLFVFFLLFASFFFFCGRAGLFTACLGCLLLRVGFGAVIVWEPFRGVISTWPTGWGQYIFDFSHSRSVWVKTGACPPPGRDLRGGEHRALQPHNFLLCTSSGTLRGGPSCLLQPCMRHLLNICVSDSSGDRPASHMSRKPAMLEQNGLAVCLACIYCRHHTPI